MQEDIRRPAEGRAPQALQDAAAISELAGLHRHYVSDIERGAHNLCLETITKLAWALRSAEFFRDFTLAELDTIYGD